MPIELIKISSLQLESLPRNQTVFFFSVAPIEDHGPHLPMGLDLEEAERLCFLAAQHLEIEMPGWVGVIMPRAPLGVESNTTRLSITVRPHVLRDWLVDSSRALMRIGFFHFVCFSGHLGPRQLTAIEDAGKKIWSLGRWPFHLNRLRGLKQWERASLISVSSALVTAQDVLQSPFWPDPEEHGGKRDTSIALAIAGDQVNPNYQTLPPTQRNSSRWLRNWNRRRRRMTNYWGNPAQATAQLGERELLATLDKSFSKMRAVWEGSPPRSTFRSWYSILPPNKSFFRAWILFILIILFIVCWAYLAASTLNLANSDAQNCKSQQKISYRAKFISNSSPSFPRGAHAKNSKFN